MPKEYWQGWPFEGEYVNDLNWAAAVGKQYLDKIVNKPSSKQKCVIFDIDDTLFFGDPERALGENGVGELDFGRYKGQDVFLLPRNKPIVKLLEYAKKLGFIVVLLTARPPTSKLACKLNMEEHNIPYDAIVMNEKEEDFFFKIRARRNISKKYDIVLTVGDRATDCTCPGTAAAIKLPEEGSLCSYAWIPPF